MAAFENVPVEIDPYSGERRSFSVTMSFLTFPPPPTSLSGTQFAAHILAYCDCDVVVRVCKWQ